uniref:Uncharacterized protein n=1 Tax=Glossina austeni TaxID=7395 RepID=A0A1A9UGX4_GLOAU
MDGILRTDKTLGTTIPNKEVWEKSVQWRLTSLGCYYGYNESILKCRFDDSVKTCGSASLSVYGCRHIMLAVCGGFISSWAVAGLIGIAAVGVAYYRGSTGERVINEARLILSKNSRIQSLTIPRHKTKCIGNSRSHRISSKVFEQIRCKASSNEEKRDITDIISKCSHWSYTITLQVLDP